VKAVKVRSFLHFSDIVGYNFYDRSHLRGQAAELHVSFEWLVAGLVCDTIEGFASRCVAPLENYQRITGGSRSSWAARLAGSTTNYNVDFHRTKCPVSPRGIEGDLREVRNSDQRASVSIPIRSDGLRHAGQC